MTGFVWKTCCIFSALILVTAGSAYNDNVTQHQTAASRLYKRLMRTYDEVNPDRVLLPNFQRAGVVDVKYGISLIRLVDVDAKSRIANMLMWDKLTWTDDLLKWDPKEYDGIKTLRIPIDRIWSPDIEMFNRHDANPEDVFSALALVYSSGDVLYIPPKNRKVVCSSKKSSVYECSMSFGSWTYDANMLDLNPYGDLMDVDVSDYTANEDYALLEHSGKRNVKHYPGVPEPYVTLKYNLTFKKN